MCGSSAAAQPVHTVGSCAECGNRTAHRARPKATDNLAPRHPPIPHRIAVACSDTQSSAGAPLRNEMSRRAKRRAKRLFLCNEAIADFRPPCKRKEAHPTLCAKPASAHALEPRYVRAGFDSRKAFVVSKALPHCNPNCMHNLGAAPCRVWYGAEFKLSSPSAFQTVLLLLHYNSVAVVRHNPGLLSLELEDDLSGRPNRVLYKTPGSRLQGRS